METNHELNVYADNRETKRDDNSVRGGIMARYIIIIALFLLPIIIIGAISVFDTDAAISVRENRMLKKIPAFSFGELFFGNYPLEFEEYYIDTFPFRDDMLVANTELNRLYYFSLPSSGEDVTLLIPQDNDIASGGEAAVPETESEDTHEPAADNTPGPDIGEPGGSIPGENTGSPLVSPSAGGENPNTDQEPVPEATEEPDPLPELEAPEKADLWTGIIIVGDRAMEISVAIPRS